MMTEQSFPTDAAHHAFKGFDLFKAGPANGKSGYINERRVADTAIGRNQDREQAFSRVLKNVFQPA
jgi:hypothetical protein